MTEPSVWKWSKETIKEYWRTILFISLASALLAVAGATFPIVWQFLIDRAVAGSIDYWLSVLFICLFVIEASPIVYVLRSLFINRYEFDTRYRLFKHVLRLSIPFHKEKESTKMLQEANKGVDAGTQLLRMFMNGSILADVPVGLFAFIYVAYHSWQAALILLGFMAIFLFLSVYLGKKISKVAEEYHDRDNEVSTRMREVLQHVETVKLHQAENQERDWYMEHGGRVLELDNRLTKYTSWFNLMSGLSHVLPFGVALILFLPAVAAGEITVGTLIALQMYSMRAVSPAGFLGDMYQDIKTNAAQLKPALRLLQQQQTVREAKQPVEMNPLRHEIKLQNVSFRYPGTEKPLINNVSLSITAGEKVAVVGKTGSGKTTLARLLVRFYDPDHGLITMDGTDLRQFSFDSLYRQICFVTQEVPVFSGTIGDNVSYGVTSCNEDHVIKACTSASADFVFQRPEGLKTMVGEMGEKLSGGERQRLSLARAFLRKPSLVILDEATSSVDPITEHEVQTAFDRLLQMNGGTTMVVIAHRITTVKNADRIFVLGEGQIEDIGSHKELLARCDLYRKLCQGMAK